MRRAKCQALYFGRCAPADRFRQRRLGGHLDLRDHAGHHRNLAPQGGPLEGDLPHLVAQFRRHHLDRNIPAFTDKGVTRRGFSRAHSIAYLCNCCIKRDVAGGKRHAQRIETQGVSAANVFVVQVQNLHGAAGRRSFGQGRGTCRNTHHPIHDRAV